MTRSRLLLKTITPQQIRVALAAADEVTDRQVRTHRAAELAVERARYEADRAERAFVQVEPENPLVARTLASRWEAKLAALAEAEAALATARAVKPQLPDHDALRALAADLPRLRDAPTTSPRDPKRLLRSLIADVTLLLEQDSDVARIGVRWHTSIHDALGPGGTFLMNEPRLSSNLDDNLDNPMAPFIYAVSTLHCLTVPLADGGAGLGTAFGEQTARQLLANAGFGEVAVHDAPGDPGNAVFVTHKPPR